MLINDALKVVRIYWGKTQSELADTLGLSQSYISEVEKGKREVTLDLLGRYSKELRIPMSSLMLFAERVKGVPAPTRGKMFVAGKALTLLKRLIPDELEQAG